MQLIDLTIPDVKLLTPRKFEDNRGFFAEVYKQDVLERAGLCTDFIQDNHSLSRRRGVVRGLHFQRPPFAQAKLVRVIRGSVLDVAVDLRRESPTFGHHVSAVLSAAELNQLYIPVGFAHGFCTLEPDTEILYKVTAPYAPEHDDGILWNDPALNIDWPVGAGDAILSEKDKQLQRLDDLADCFCVAAQSESRR